MIAKLGLPAVVRKNIIRSNIDKNFTKNKKHIMKINQFFHLKSRKKFFTSRIVVAVDSNCFLTGEIKL